VSLNKTFKLPLLTHTLFFFTHSKWLTVLLPTSQMYFLTISLYSLIRYLYVHHWQRRSSWDFTGLSTDAQTVLEKNVTSKSRPLRAAKNRKLKPKVPLLLCSPTCSTAAALVATFTQPLELKLDPYNNEPTLRLGHHCLHLQAKGLCGMGTGEEYASLVCEVGSFYCPNSSSQSCILFY